MALALSVSSARAAVLASLAPRGARGYAASAASAAMRHAAAAAEGGAAGEAKEAGRRAAEVSWVPDPVSGHYRPSNWAAAVDPADLRAAHLARTYARA